MILSMAFEATLDRCLQTFLQEEQLDCRGNDQYLCSACSKQSRAAIKTELSKLPNIMVFHLKRFLFPSMKKITGRLKYHSYLKMDK